MSKRFEVETVDPNRLVEDIMHLIDNPHFGNPEFTQNQIKGLALELEDYFGVLSQKEQQELYDVLPEKLQPILKKIMGETVSADLKESIANLRDFANDIWPGDNRFEL